MIDTVVLCGGFGKRLRSTIKDRPKPMADFNGEPFLDLLMDYIHKHGFGRFILCAGYKGEFIENYYRGKDKSYEVIVSTEPEPLGTAGALKIAEKHIKSKLFLVVNGDSICKIDFQNLMDSHIQNNAMSTVVLVSMGLQGDYGLIKLEKNNEISVFHDKKCENNSDIVSAGIYLFNRKLLNEIPEKKNVSLEYDILPKFVGRGLYGYYSRQKLFDIGTPERLEFARQNLI